MYPCNVTKRILFKVSGDATPDELVLETSHNQNHIPEDCGTSVFEMEDPNDPGHYIHVEDASSVTVGTDDKQPIDVVSVSNTGDDLNITHAKQFIDSLDRVWARPAVFMDTMFVGKADGTLQWMEEPPVNYAGAFDGIDVGRSASPCVFEWQSQTYLIVGNRNGDLKQFKLNGNTFVVMNDLHFQI